MKNRILKIINYLFFLSLAIVLMYYCFRDVNAKDLIEGLKEANYGWIALSMLIGMIANIIRGLRWKLLIEPLHYQPSSVNTYHAVMIGYLANFALPRVGEVTRCAVLNKTDKVPFNSLLGTVVTERVVDLICLFIAVALVFFIRIDFFGAFLSDIIFIPLGEKVKALFSISIWVWIVLGLFVLAFFTSIFAFKHYLRNISLVVKIWNLIKGVLEGLKAIFKMKKWPVFILYSFFIWTAYWLTSYCTMLAIPVTASLTPADALFLMIVGGLGWIVPVQGGFGAYHLIVSLGLTIYGIPRDEGIIFATISHESQAIVMLFFGFISAIAVFLFNRRNKVMKPTTNQTNN